ncbi:MAG: hypothetical protein WA021_00485 [Minisyncoccia bacterium]
MDTETEKPRGRISYGIWVTWMFVWYIVDRIVDGLSEYTRIIRREPDLFLGVTLFLLGLLNFNSGKFCDGNAADYLSCTRPATYYYFDAVDVALIILGIFCILIWFQKRRTA